MIDVQAKIAELTAIPDERARNDAFREAIKTIGFSRDLPPDDLDALVTIGKAAIDNARATAARWLDEANITCFNMAANLADCWADGSRREQRHFEAGLAFADEALELRKQLNKGERPFAMAYWAKGKHLLSLGRFKDAADAFRAGKDEAWTTLAEWKAGVSGAEARYRAAVKALEGTEHGKDTIAQLEESRRLN